MSLIWSSASHQPKLPPPKKWIPAVLMYKLTSTPNKPSFHTDVFSVSMTDTRTHVRQTEQSGKDIYLIQLLELKLVRNYKSLGPLPLTQLCFS